jgi:orotate phosphoribosyltransferase
MTADFSFEWRAKKFFDFSRFLGHSFVNKTYRSFRKTLYFWRMTVWDESALKVAEFLLQIKAIKLSPKEPFEWASGWKSPIYCDNRLTLSYPTIRTYIRQQFVKIIEETYAKPDVIAGVATGGIALGALVAQELGVPFCYIRSEMKDHGMQNQIEGVLNEGQNVVIIEDLVSTGMSSLKAVKAVREAGANVKGMVAIFTYGFEKAETAFADANCELTTLSNYESLVDQAFQSGFLNESEIEGIKEWRVSPSTWNA